MKYFTKEELEDITKELLEKPTCETLKNLSKKYNDNVEKEDAVVKEVGSVTIEPPVVESAVSPVSNSNIPSMEINKMESDLVNNNAGISEMPSFELPKLDAPIVSNQNNEPINFTGNLFETQNPTVGNLMQTTDNFNSVPNAIPTTEVPVTGAPFFGPHIEQGNNPIPVSGTVNNTPMQGPTMFGQLEQNYM